MIELKCGCQVTGEGKFIVGEVCNNKNCIECKILVDLHPFGSKRLK